MAKKRVEIPEIVASRILFQNDMTCCICRDKSKRVQIHHIDHDPSNNSFGNLCVVCPLHHDEIHLKGGSTRGFTKRILYEYKSTWEKKVLDGRRTNFPSPADTSKVTTSLYDFEIRKVAHIIASLGSRASGKVEESLEFLYSIHLLEGHTEKILEAIEMIIIPSAHDTRKITVIAEHVHHYFWHLVDPDLVRMDVRDRKNLKRVIDILGSIGHYSAQLNRNIKIIKKLAISFKFILDVAIAYKDEKIANLAVTEIKAIKALCSKRDRGETSFSSAVAELDKLLSDGSKFASLNKLGWRIW